MSAFLEFLYKGTFSVKKAGWANFQKVDEGHVMCSFLDVFPEPGV